MGSDLGNKTIGLKQDADLTKRDNWEEYLDWLTEFLKTQKNCLSEYVGSITEERKNPPQSCCVWSVKSRCHDYLFM
jgi:hypothetical protein